MLECELYVIKTKKEKGESIQILQEGSFVENDGSFSPASGILTENGSFEGNEPL